MPNPEPIALRRCISLPLLTFYGLGNILGAGIYVLVGKVAGVAGLFAPLAFLLAALVAGFTALAYAELAARFPAGRAGQAQPHAAIVRPASTCRLRSRNSRSPAACCRACPHSWVATVIEVRVLPSNLSCVRRTQRSCGS